MKYISGAVGTVLLIYLLSMSRVSIFGNVCYIIGHAKTGELFGADVTQPMCLYPSIYYTGIIFSLALIAISAMLIAKEILISPASSKAPSASSYRQSSQPYPVSDALRRNFDASGLKSSAATKRYDEKKWKALLDVDGEIAEAAQRVRGFGQRYEDELAEKYLILSEKSYLPAIVAKIEEAAKSTKPVGRGSKVDVGVFWKVSWESYEDGSVTGFFPPDGTRDFVSMVEFRNFVKSNSAPIYQG